MKMKNANARSKSARSKSARSKSAKTKSVKVKNVRKSAMNVLEQENSSNALPANEPLQKLMAVMLTEKVANL